MCDCYIALLRLRCKYNIMMLFKIIFITYVFIGFFFCLTFTITTAKYSIANATTANTKYGIRFDILSPYINASLYTARSPPMLFGRTRQAVTCAFPISFTQRRTGTATCFMCIPMKVSPISMPTSA